MALDREENSALLRVSLEKMERKGIKLFLNGVPSTTEYIVKSCLNDEDTVYMPDYVTDECGRLKEIRYDRISAED